MMNPTGLPIRNDSSGYGHFGAPRGNRKHDGVDFLCEPGQIISCPIHADYAEVSYPYGDDLYWKGLRLYSQRIQIVMWYFMPYKDLVLSASIAMGSAIGIAQDISVRYNDPQMQPHIHLRVEECDPMLLIK